MERPTGARWDGAKRARCEHPAADLLSALPDALLLHILSFLWMEEAVATSLLSRRWRHLWTSNPCLDFSCNAPPDFIDRALLLLEGTKLTTFRAAVHLPEEGTQGREYENTELVRMVDSWLRFTLRRRVEEMVLDCFEIDEGEYTLPDCVFTSESLVSLTLHHCNLDLPSRIHMRSLKTLTLCSVTMLNDNLEDLLAGCPSLECLTLENCPSIFYPGVYLGGADSCLKTLNICVDSFPDDVLRSDVRISAPSVTTLILSGYLRRYSVKDLSSIATAVLDFGLMAYCELDADSCKYLAELVCQLRRVKVLKLCGWCVQALSRMAFERSRFSSEFNILHLEFTLGSMTCEFPVIINALRSFTKVESLTIDICDSKRSTFKDDAAAYYDDEIQDVTPNEVPSPPTMLLHLKTVSIFGLVSGICAEQENKEAEEILEKYQSEFQLIRFLLESSLVLERLTINTNVNTNKLTKKKVEILSTISSRLLALPKASPVVLVII